MKSYDVFIFDLYGTLIDIHTDESKTSFWKDVQKVFSSYGAKYRWDELRDSYFEKVSELEAERYQEGHRIEIDLSEVFRSLLKDKGVDGDDRMIEMVAGSFRKHSTSHIRLYAGTKELLKGLQDMGKKVCLLSNAQELFTLREMKDLGIYDLFDDIFISSGCGYKKPDPVFMEMLMRKHGLDAKKCLMIGNDLHDDVSVAAAVGMDSYYIESALSSDRECDEDPVYVQKGMDLKLLFRRIVTADRENER